MKPIKCGIDFIRDKNWKPIVKTRKGAQQLADKTTNQSVIFDADAMLLTAKEESE